MSLFRRDSMQVNGERGNSRGQALVEFALVLPLVALLIVMAVDFGRVYFGWVSLTNAARNGANYAGHTPDLLTNASDRSEYGTLLENSVTGCTMSPADGDDAAYDPTFTDIDGDGKDNGWGDQVSVQMSCELGMITPLASLIVGQDVSMDAVAVFPVRSGSFAGPGGGGGGPPNPPCTLSFIPDLLNRTVAEARQKWIDEGFDPARFAANPDIADNLVNGQTFTPAGNVQDCVDPTGQSVFVTTVNPPPCPSGQAQVPDLIGKLVSQAKLDWTAAGFTGNFNPNNADDSKTVLTQVTSPLTSPPINGCVTITASVAVTFGDPPPAPCDVPNMIGLTLGDAEDLWDEAGFNTALTHSGQVNKLVKEQDPNHPGVVSCDVVGKVKLQ